MIICLKNNKTLKLSVLLSEKFLPVSFVGQEIDP